MAGKKKTAPAADALVAASPILIEGKHFDPGDPIKGCSKEEVRKAVSIGRVVKYADFVARFGEPTDPEAEATAKAEAEAKAKADAEATAKAEAEAKAKADAESAAKGNSPQG